MHVGDSAFRNLQSRPKSQRHIFLECRVSVPVCMRLFSNLEEPFSYSLICAAQDLSLRGRVPSCHFLLQKFRAADTSETSIQRQMMGQSPKEHKRVFCHSCNTPLGPSGNCPMPACVQFRRSNAAGSKEKQQLRPDWALPRGPASTSQAEATARSGSNLGSYYLDEASSNPRLTHPKVFLQSHAAPPTHTACNQLDQIIAFNRLKMQCQTQCVTFFWYL